MELLLTSFLLQISGRLLSHYPNVLVSRLFDGSPQIHQGYHPGVVSDMGLLRSQVHTGLLDSYPDPEGSFLWPRVHMAADHFCHLDLGLLISHGYVT